jgi:hypothetical protein
MLHAPNPSAWLMAVPQVAKKPFLLSPIRRSPDLAARGPDTHKLWSRAIRRLPAKPHQKA